MTVNARQAIALWDAMIGTHFVGVAEDQAIEADNSPLVQKLLASMFDDLPYETVTMQNEAYTVQKTQQLRLRRVFQELAEALG